MFKDELGCLPITHVDASLKGWPNYYVRGCILEDLLITFLKVGCTNPTYGKDYIFSCVQIVATLPKEIEARKNKRKKCHVLCVTRHVSCVMFHMSHVASHLLLVTNANSHRQKPPPDNPPIMHTRRTAKTNN